MTPVLPFPIHFVQGISNTGAKGLYGQFHFHLFGHTFWCWGCVLFLLLLLSFVVWLLWLCCVVFVLLFAPPPTATSLTIAPLQYLEGIVNWEVRQESKQQAGRQATLLAHDSPYDRRRHRVNGLLKVESRLSCDSIPTTKTQRIHYLLETGTLAPALLICVCSKGKREQILRKELSKESFAFLRCLLRFHSLSPEPVFFFYNFDFIAPRCDTPIVVSRRKQYFFIVFYIRFLSTLIRSLFF